MFHGENMTAVEVLHWAAQDGLALEWGGAFLTWSADHQPPLQLLVEIKSHRLAIIEVLWLADVASLLACDPSYLRERHFIDSCDLSEHRTTLPQLAAQLIRSHPIWAEAQAPTQHSRVIHSSDCQLHLRHSTATAAPEWCEFHNLYIGHLMTCRRCYAPTGHYCATGAELRAEYTAIP
jgi:hypothetical protein